jgi:hypothetical protein
LEKAGNVLAKTKPPYDARLPRPFYVRFDEMSFTSPGGEPREIKVLVMTMVTTSEVAIGRFKNELPAWTVQVRDQIEELAWPDRQAFLAMKWRLLANPNYIGKFIAVLDGRIIDSDADKAALAKRVYANYGYRRIYMDQVTPDEREYRIEESTEPSADRSFECFPEKPCAVCGVLTSWQTAPPNDPDGTYRCRECWRSGRLPEGVSEDAFGRR